MATDPCSFDTATAEEKETPVASSPADGHDVEGAYCVHLAMQCVEPGCDRIQGATILVRSESVAWMARPQMLGWLARFGWRVIGWEDPERVRVYCPVHAAWDSTDLITDAITIRCDTVFDESEIASIVNAIEQVITEAAGQPR